MGPVLKGTIDQKQTFFFPSSDLVSIICTPKHLTQNLIQYFNVSLLWRIVQYFHLLCINAYIFLDATQGHANFFELYFIVN